MGYPNKSLRQETKPMFFYLRFLIFVLLLSSCGYKPVSRYTAKVIPQPLYLEVKLSSKEPDSGVFLRDELYNAIVHRLGVRVTLSQTATGKLIVSYDDISYTVLGYDEAGYVERYRVNMTTTFTLISDKMVLKRKIKTTHEADVTQNVTKSSRAKQEAIKECTKKAVDQFVAFMASNSARIQE